MPITPGFPSETRPAAKCEARLNNRE